MVSGELTVVTPARPKSRSLRTTIPMGIVRHFEIKKGDKLDWSIEVRNKELVIVIRKLSK